MTKSELIKTVATATGASQKVTGEIINETFNQIPKTLAAGDTVDINGFGAFEVRFYEEKVGYHPRTSEKMTIPAHNAPRFKPYKAFKELINGVTFPETKKAPAVAEAE